MISTSKIKFGNALIKDILILTGAKVDAFISVTATVKAFEVHKTFDRLILENIEPYPAIPEFREYFNRYEKNGGYCVIPSSVFSLDNNDVQIHVPDHIRAGVRENYSNWYYYDVKEDKWIEKQ